MQYLIPAPVIEYIEQHGCKISRHSLIVIRPTILILLQVYEDDNATPADGKGKSNGTSSSGRESPAIGSSASKS